MRHLFVTNDFPPKRGGIESYLLGLCRGLDPADVIVAAPTRPGQEEVDAALPFRVERMGRRYLRPNRSLVDRLESLAREADAVHVLQALPLGRLAHRGRFEVPVTVFAHGSEILVPSRVPFVRRSLRKVLRRADLVVAASAFTADAVRDVAGVGSTVIHPPVDVERFSLGVAGSTVLAEHGLGGRFVVLFVGRLVKRKGAEVLVRAMVHLRHGTALIVGSGPEEASLRRLARELDVADRVVFAGHVPDPELPAHYAAGDVFCMPCTDRYGGADTEGFGIVYLEAAASGLPSVAGRCGGSVEAVRDGETGVILDDVRPEPLAEALEALRTDSGRRLRLAAAGRAWAEELSQTAQAERLTDAVRALRETDDDPG